MEAILCFVVGCQHVRSSSREGELRLDRGEEGSAWGKKKKNRDTAKEFFFRRKIRIWLLQCWPSPLGLSLLIDYRGLARLQAFSEPMGHRRILGSPSWASGSWASPLDLKKAQHQGSLGTEDC